MERRVVRMVALAGVVVLVAVTVVEWVATGCVGPAFGVYAFNCQPIAPPPGVCTLLMIVGANLVGLAWLAALARLAALRDWLVFALVLFLFLPGLVVYFVAEREDTAAA